MRDADQIVSWLQYKKQTTEIDHMPLVTLSYAQSIDGSIALQKGQPAAISGPESLILTHRLRSQHDGILVGIGTVLADNPQLTVRLVEGVSPRPIVLDSKLRLPLNAKLLDRDGNLPWIVCGPGHDRDHKKKLEARGVKIIEVQVDSKNRVDLSQTLKKLYRLGIQSLMVEGGGQTIQSLLVSGYCHLGIITISPRWLGGYRSVESLDESHLKPRLIESQAAVLGDDFVIYGNFERVERWND